MFKIFLLIMVLFSLSSTMAEDKVYDCNFRGINAILTIRDDHTASLKKLTKTYNCELGHVRTLPDVDVEVPALHCIVGRGKIDTYYYGEIDGDIVLSKGLVWPVNTYCRRL